MMQPAGGRPAVGAGEQRVAPMLRLHPAYLAGGEIEGRLPGDLHHGLVPTALPSRRGAVLQEALGTMGFWMRRSE